jgi:hypothetical protein
MTRITRADAEIDAKLEREERKRKEAELRAQGIQPPKPADTEPKTALGWVVYTIGSLLVLAFFIGFYFLVIYNLPR